MPSDTRSGMSRTTARGLLIPSKILSWTIVFMQCAISRVGWRAPDCPRAGRSGLPPARPAGA